MDNKPEIEIENDRLLDKLLREEPDYFLPDDFADHLVKRIRIRESIKQNTMEFLTIMGAIVGLLVCFVCTCYFLYKDNFMVIKSLAFNGYTPVVGLIIIFVFFMDKVMLMILNQLN